MAHGGKRRGAGRKKGSKSKATLDREAANRIFREMAIERVRPLFNSQLLLATGSVYVYRIDRHERKGEPTRIEHVLLKETAEIADALDTLANGDENGDERGNGYVYVTVKPPENKAIDSILDRALGKAAQVFELPPDADLGTVVGFTFIRNGKRDTAGAQANG